MPQPCRAVCLLQECPLLQDTAALTLMLPPCHIPTAQAVVEEAKRVIIAEERLVLKYCQDRAARLKSEVKPLDARVQNGEYKRRRGAVLLKHT